MGTVLVRQLFSVFLNLFFVIKSGRDIRKIHFTKKIILYFNRGIKFKKKSITSKKQFIFKL